MTTQNETLGFIQTPKINTESNCINKNTEIKDFNDTNIINLKQELEILSKRYELLVNTSVDGFWDWDIKSNKTYISDKLYDILGINKEIQNIKEITIDDFVHPEDIVVRKKAINKCLEDGNSYSIEYRLKVKSGEYRYFSSRGKLERDQNNNPIRMIGTLIDIHEKKTNEQNLKLYEYVIENTLKPIAWINKFGKLIRANKSYLDLLGYTEEEFAQLDMSKVDDNYNGENWQNHWKDLEDKKTIRLVTKNKRKDGKYVDIEVVANYVKIEEIEFNCAFINDITEKLALEREIKKKDKKNKLLNKKYLDLINSVNGVVWEADANTTEFSFVSKQAEEIIGYPVENWTENVNFWPSLIVNDDRNYALNYCKTYTERKEDHTFEYRMRKKNGDIIWIQDIVKVEIKDNKPYKLKGIMIDITNQKKSEKELIESENKLRAVIESTKDIVFAVDKEFNYMTFNQNHFNATKALYGSEIEIGKRMLDYVLNEEDRKSIETNIKKSFNGEFVTAIQEYGNEDKIYLEGSANPIYNANNEISGAAIFVRDVTDKIKSELALKESEQRFRKLLNDIPNIAVQGYDRSGKIVYWNKASETFYGYSAKEAIGNDIHILLHPKENIEDARKFTEKLFDSKLNTQPEEFSVIRKDGSKMTVLASNAFIELADGSLELYCIDVDLTYIKQAENEIKELVKELTIKNELVEVNLEQKNALLEELEHTNQKLNDIIKEKDKLFTIIAHDLRSPLSGFMSLSKEMADNIEDLSTIQITEFAKSLKNSSENVYLLLENLLKWSQFQRGTIEFEPEIIYLKYIVENNISILLSKTISKEIELISYINSDTNFIADVKMFNVILRNLLSNAIKFTPRGGKIEIGLVEKDSKYYENKNVTIFIKDSGIGIPENMIENLFKVNSKNYRVGTENEASSGLGLVLCKEFIAKHKGNIFVESKEGIGTTFFISLPIEQ